MKGKKAASAGGVDWEIVLSVVSKSIVRSAPVRKDFRFYFRDTSPSFGLPQNAGKSALVRLTALPKENPGGIFAVLPLR